MLEKVKFLSIENLINELKQLEFAAPIFILDRNRAQVWGIEETIDAITKKNKTIWIDKIDPNPTQYSIFEALNSIESFNCDILVAIGGGSTIDLAKALACFKGLTIATPDACVKEIKMKTYVDNIKLPIIAVPSTAGTGSEVTSWATVWDKSNGEKYSLDSDKLEPTQAWIVPELTDSLPPRVRLSTALDAVSHAIESYWAKKSNLLVKQLSLTSLKLMSINLPKLLKNNKNEEARDNVCLASLFAGLSFGITRTTASHSISYPLTSRYNIEHGFACAMTLNEVAKYNSRVVDLKSVFEIFQPFGGIDSWLQLVSQGIVILKLSEFKVKQSDFDAIVDKSFTGGRIDNNPVELKREDIKKILENVF